MKKTIIWVIACLVVGVVGAALYVYSRPEAVAARVEAKLKTGHPDPKARLVTRSFTNAGHTYKLKFYSDALVDKGGRLATNAGQSQVLARPGTVDTSYVVMANPIDNAHASLRSDCGSRNPSTVEFAVKLYGGEVSVCHSTSQPFNIYAMDVRATGTWEQIIFFNNALISLQPHDAQIKEILGSLVID